MSQEMIELLREDLRKKREDIEILQTTEDYLEVCLNLCGKYDQSAEERIRIRTAMRYNSSLRTIEEGRFAKLKTVLELYGGEE